jgi:hypothetical protein
MSPSTPAIPPAPATDPAGSTATPDPRDGAPAAPPDAPPDRPAASWDRMVERELRAATGRPGLTLAADACGRQPCRMLVRPPRDLVGLALSGGGNRSATFNLGLLQGLADLNLLPAFDYLATVSGGGYVGGFWSAWLSRAERTAAERRGGFPGVADGDARAEAPEVRHLRQFSNFLSPRVGLLSWDTGRMVAAAVSGLVPAFAAALALVALTLSLWTAVAWALSVTAPGARHDGALLAGAALAAPLGVLLVALEWGWLRSKPDAPARAAYRLSAAGAVLVAGLTWALALRARVGAYGGHELRLGAEPAPPLVGRAIALDAELVLAPVAACAAAAAVLAMLRMLLSRRRATTPGLRGSQSAAERVIARVIFAGAVWAAGGGVWLAGAALAGAGALGRPGTSAGAAGVLALLTALFARVQKFVAYLPRGAADGSRARRLAPLAPQVLAYVILGGVAVLVASGLVALHRAAPVAGLVPAVCAAYGAALLVTLATAVCFDPTRSGCTRSTAPGSPAPTSARPTTPPAWRTRPRTAATTTSRRSTRRPRPRRRAPGGRRRPRATAAASPTTPAAARARSSRATTCRSPRSPASGRCTWCAARPTTSPRATRWPTCAGARAAPCSPPSASASATPPPGGPAARPRRTRRPPPPTPAARSRPSRSARR